jgi:hypothetical protein
MPQETNLNVSPYFDDFDSSKNYYKILFKPSFPVQARELTGLQSILQNQIEKFGDNIFKEGSVVIPGQLNYNDRLFAIEVDPEFLGISLENYIDSLINKTIVGNDTNISARILHVLDEREERNTYTLYLNYLSSGINGESVFNDSETLKLTETVSTKTITIQSNQDFANTISSNASSIGSGVIISEGVYYLRGHFVNVYDQFLILEPHSNLPTYRVGLEIIESIVTYGDDESLADNAQGFNNYSAPGADRFKIEPILAKRKLDDSNENFVELLVVSNGEIRNIRESSRPEYNIIRDEIARRTYETSGNYYVNPFSVSVKETLNNLKGNNGIFAENQLTYNNNTPSDNLATYKISPGKAFVKGYEVDIKSARYIDFEKPRETSRLDDQSINYFTGLNLTFNRVYGSPKIDSSFSSIFSLRDSRIETLSNQVSGKEIGLGRVYDFKLQSGSYDTIFPNLNEWEMSAFDIQMYTEFELNEPIESISVPTRITGRSSGSIGFLRFDSSQSGIITAYDIKGNFSIGEQLIFDSIDETRVITKVNNYSISDVKSSYSELNNGSVFNADLKLNESLFIGTASISPESVGISTITSSTFNFINYLKKDDVVSYSTPGLEVPTFVKVVDVFRNQIIVNSIATVSGVCDGNLPQSDSLFINDLRLLRGSFNNFGNDSLYTPLPKEYISSVFLENSSITIRKEYPVNITNNSTDIILSGDNLLFLPFDEGRYTLTRSNGVNEILTRDKFSFSSGSRELRISGLGANDFNARLIATLKKDRVTEKIKNKEKINSIIIDRSTNKSSGIGITTLNDGLTYGKYPYGTRVQDNEICLLKSDVTRLYGIFESNDINDPQLPSLILTELSGPNARTEDLIIGDEIIGENSKAIAILVGKPTSSKIEFVYLNSNSFSRGENIIFKNTGIRAFINTIEQGSNNITNNFIFDHGSKSFIYDYSKIIRKNKSKPPTKKIKIIYESAFYSPSDTGDITTANSYNQFNYKEISTVDGTTRNTDILDIRPRVFDFEISENKRSPFEFLGRTFEEYNNSSKNILSSNESITLSYSYYLPRIDRIYLNTNGEFIISKGVPSDFPELSQQLDDALEIAQCTLLPYVFDVNRDVNITLLKHKRYRMQDIHSLEERIKKIEFFTTLSLLETNTKNLKILDSNGLDRFKSGFVVDNFTTHDVQSVDSEIRNSIDSNNRELRPSHYTTEIDLILGTEGLLTESGDSEKLIGFGTKKTGRIITLDYDNIIQVSQPYATRVENVTPYLVKSYTGSLELFPSSDVWIDEVRADANTIEIDNFTSALEAGRFDPQTGLGPINWGEWETTWTGKTVSTNTVVNRDYYGYGWRPGWGWGWRWWAGWGWRNWWWRPYTETTSTTVTTTLTGTETRQGERQIITEFNEQFSQGDSVINIDIIPTMRSRNIQFIGRNLKPFTQVYGFFDGVNVSSFMIPKLIEINMVSGTFVSGETILGFKGNSEIVFRSANINHRSGAINSPTDIFTSNPYDRDIQIPSNYTSTSTLLNVDTISLCEQAESQFYGYIEKDMLLRGLTSGAEARVSNVRLFTDRIGSIIGSFFIPSPYVPTNPRFDTGIKTLKITSNQTNSIIPGLTDTYAEENYFAQGQLNTVQERIISVRQPRFETEILQESRDVTQTTTQTSTNTNVGYVCNWWWTAWDPLAQSFKIFEPTGVFATKLDLFFQSKDELLPVVVQIRTMSLGLPTQEIVPLSEVFIYPDEINISDDASIATSITFPSPVYLTGETEYAITLLSQSNNYKVWISRLGEIDVQSLSGPESQQIVVTEQPNLGSLFKSQNSSTWTPSQYEDLKFTLYKANFKNESGTVNFFNPNLGKGNKQIANLVKDSLEINSRFIRVGLGTTISDNQINFGNTVIQNSTKASGNFVGVGGSAFGDLEIVNPGIGYTPFSGTFTYENVPTISLTGQGKNSRIDLTISNGVAIGCTIVNGGSGYLIGDLITVEERTLGSEQLGRNLVLSISDIKGINELLLDNVQGEFEVSQNKELEYIDSLGNILKLNSGNVYINDIELMNDFNDGLHIKVNHKNHGMHSLVNNVKIEDVSSDLPLVSLLNDYPLNSTSNILISSADNFIFFENELVSSTNPGYILLEKEIIAYTGVSGNELTGIVRGIDQTSITSHFTGSFVQKYELSGISLRRINKIHNLQNSDVENSITLDSYYIKLDMSSSNKGSISINGLNGQVNRTIETLYPKLYISNTKSCGGSKIYCTQNISYEIVRPVIQTLTLPGTSINSSIRTISGTSISGNEISYLDKGFFDINLNSNNYLNSSRIVASKINETSLLNNSNLLANKSFNLLINLETTNRNISPVIDLDRIGMIFISNRVNDVVTDYIVDGRINTNSNDPNAFTYITSNILLEVPATSLKVFLSSYINIFSDVRVLYSVSNEIDKNKVYYPFPGYDNLDSNKNIIDIKNNSGLPDKPTVKTDVLSFNSSELPYREYEFTADNLPSFKTFSIKIIGTSKNQAYPPRFRELRVIALA